MGVRQGLETFVRNHQPDLGQLIAATKSTPLTVPLVLDGNAVLFHLAARSGSDPRFDGDFSVFATYAKRWLTVLAVVAPRGLHVLFDGMPAAGKAAETLQRARDRVATVQRTCAIIMRDAHEPLSPHDARVLPARFLGAVFRELLTAASVPWAVCEDEADCAVATFAVAQGAFVVSRDTDFLIFPVPGYVPLPDMDVDTVEGQGATLRLFRPSSLTTALRLPPVLLPLWACILGNDVVPQDAFSVFRTSAVCAAPRGPAVLLGVAHTLAQLYDGDDGDDGDDAARRVASTCNAVIRRVAGHDTVAYASLSALLSRGLASYNVPVPATPAAADCVSSLQHAHATGRIPSLLASLQLRGSIAWPVVLEDTRPGRASTWDSVLAPLRRLVIAPFAPVREWMRVGSDYAVVLDADAPPDAPRPYVLRGTFGESCLSALSTLSGVTDDTKRVAATLVLCEMLCGARPDDADGVICACRTTDTATSPPVTMAGVRLVSVWLGVVTLVSMAWAAARDGPNEAPSLRVLGDGRLCFQLLHVLDKERTAHGVVKQRSRELEAYLLCPMLRKATITQTLPPSLAALALELCMERAGAAAKKLPTATGKATSTVVSGHGSVRLAKNAFVGLSLEDM